MDSAEYVDNQQQREVPIGGGPKRLVLVIMAAICCGVLARVVLSDRSAGQEKPAQSAQVSIYS